MLTEKDVLAQMDDPTSECKIVVAKEKKKGGYTLYPQVKELRCVNVPMIGPCWAIIFEE